MNDVDWWRKASFSLARALKVKPILSRVRIDVFTFMNAPLQDPANCYSSVKAMIDGLIDAKVLKDDTGAEIASITFHAPERTSRRADQGVRLEIRPDVARD